VNRRWGLGIGVAAVAAAAVVALGGGTEGTVVAKNGEAPPDYACRSGAVVTFPVSVPVWGACAGRCWRLSVRDSSGAVSDVCVSEEDYDRTQPGAFWHGRTDGP
jgi:hypothetical protein